MKTAIYIGRLFLTEEIIGREGNNTGRNGVNMSVIYINN